MIKVMNLISLLVLPAIITLEVDQSSWRFVLAGVSLVVLIVAVVYSSRKSQVIAPSTTPQRQPATAGASASTPIAGE